MIDLDRERVRHILVRANNWIGDVVMISPAVRALRVHFSGARIAILAKRWVLEALSGNPDYDDLLEFDDECAHRGLAGRLRLGAELRRRSFDLAVLFQKAFEAGALAFLARARARVGWATDGRRALLTHVVPPPPPGTHHLDAFLGIARALGCVITDPLPSFRIAPDRQARADRLLTDAGLDGAAPRVALHAGASKAARAWHPERFAEVGRRLAAGARARLVLLGGPGETRLLEDIAATLPAGSALTAAGDVPLTVSAGLLARCHLFIGNDSGPMHLAAALGVPTLAIFGPGSPLRTAPRGRGPVVVLTRNYPCSPCRQDFFHECSPAPSGRPFCLEEIGVDEVESAALGLLRRHPASAGTAAEAGPTSG